MALPRRKQTRLLTIQQPTRALDSAGQPLDEWSTVLTLWTNPSGQNGLTSIGHSQGDVSSSISKYSLRIDYRPSIDNSMRVLMAGGVYRIVEARHDHQGQQWTDLVCETGAPDVG